MIGQLLTHPLYGFGEVTDEYTSPSGNRALTVRADRGDLEHQGVQESLEAEEWEIFAPVPTEALNLDPHTFYYPEYDPYDNTHSACNGMGCPDCQ